MSEDYAQGARFVIDQAIDDVTDPSARARLVITSLIAQGHDRAEGEPGIWIIHAAAAHEAGATNYGAEHYLVRPDGEEPS